MSEHPDRPEQELNGAGRLSPDAVISKTISSAHEPIPILDGEFQLSGDLGPLLSGATVRLVQLAQSDEAVLSVDAGESGIEVVFDKETGTLTLEGEALIEDYEAVLWTLRYHCPTASEDGSGKRELQVSVFSEEGDEESVASILLQLDGEQGDDGEEFAHSNGPFHPSLTLDGMVDLEPGMNESSEVGTFSPKLQPASEAIEDGRAEATSQVDASEGYPAIRSYGDEVLMEALKAAAVAMKQEGSPGGFVMIGSQGVVIRAHATGESVPPGEAEAGSANFTGFYVASPVVLDLDGDGLEFLTQAESNASFDFNGDGTPDSTAWVAPDDAFLILDLDGSGTVNHSSEVAFTLLPGVTPGSTDMEALRQVEDTNQDGELNSEDANWSKFAIWQDANSDGLSQIDEIQSLDDAGIDSIPLDASKLPRVEADGEVIVERRAIYELSDGSFRLLGDVSFLVEPENVAPGVPLLTISNAVVTEGDPDVEEEFTFDLTISSSMVAPEDITIVWSTVADGATPIDYQTIPFGPSLPPGEAMIEAGENSTTIPITIRNENLVEAYENFFVRIESATLASGSPVAVAGMGEVTILNDDSTQLSVTPFGPVEEGEPFQLVVALTNPVNSPTVATFAPVNGSATAGEDFPAFTLQVEFPGFSGGGETTIVTSIPTTDDLIFDEGEETFTLEPQSFGLSIPDPARAGDFESPGEDAVFTILDNDVTNLPVLSVAPLNADQVDGPAGALTEFTFTVTRDGDLSGTSSVEYFVAGTTAGVGGIAANEADFDGADLPSGTVDFDIGETSQLITVSVVGDTVTFGSNELLGFEGVEDFVVTLTNPVGAVIAGKSALGTIRNLDDATEGGFGRLNNLQIVENETVEEMAETVAVSRVVGQVLRINEDCEVRLILNLDGTTTVEVQIGDEVQSDQVSGLLANLDPGVFPNGATAPELPGTIDFAGLTDDSTVGGGTAVFVSEPLEISATGSTSVTQGPGTIVLGDFREGPENLMVITGQLNYIATDTTTTTRSLTEVTVTDSVLVSDSVPLQDALALLNDAGLSEMAMALDAAKEPDEPLGELVQETVNLSESEEVINTADPVTRVVAQVLKLPDDCGDLILTLNSDGTTSVQAMLKDGTTSQTTNDILGDLDLGGFEGVSAPDLATLDLGNLPDTAGNVEVNSGTVRRDDGQTVSVETSVDIMTEPGTAFIGDLDNPADIIVIAGKITITTTNVTTTTQTFTDIPFNDVVEVQEVSVVEALAILGDSAPDITAAIEAAKDDGGETGDGVLNIQEITVPVSEEVINTAEPVTRVVAQILKLPEDCGDLILTLNPDGTTSVQAILADGTEIQNASGLLGDLDLGVFDGVSAPDLAIDLSGLPSGPGTFEVNAGTIRRDDGTEVTAEESVDVSSDPGTVFIGDINDPESITVLSGQLNLVFRTTETTTQTFTDIPFSDVVEVEEVSVAETLALLGDAVPEITAAIEAAKDDDDSGDGGDSGSGSGSGQMHLIDFDTDDSNDAGDPLETGEVITDQFAHLGLTISVENVPDPARNVAMIFDSANPTGGDPDLGTANRDFGGPGKGRGGKSGSEFENTIPEGKVLIISEDGDSSDPSDRSRGGVLRFDWEQEVEVNLIEVLDIDKSNASLEFFDAAGQLIASIDIPKTGNNGVASIEVNVAGVRSMAANLPASGAITNLKWTDGGSSQGGNTAPTITTSSEFTVPEGTKDVANLEATDDTDSEGNGLAYSLTGGEDKGLFTIDVDSGELAFLSSPDFENPGDEDQDNLYHVEVTATDSGGFSDVRSIQVEVTDVSEGANEAPTILEPVAVGGGGGNGEMHLIDFDTDDSNRAGDPLETGEVISDQFAHLGLTISVENVPDPIRNVAMIFDSANPTGGDPDLGTANEDFGGPGIGRGGDAGSTFENTIPEGKVLIISEDGDSSDPSDRSRGGVLRFDWETEVEVNVVQVLDIDKRGATLEFYDATGELFETLEIPRTGNNGVATVEVNVAGVRSMAANLPASGAITNLKWSEGEGAPAVARIAVEENQSFVVDVQSQDDQDAEGAGLAYTISGGLDASQFEIDADSGALTFVTAPDFENPADTNGDNVYDVEVTVTDSGGLVDVRPIEVQVLDVAEDGPVFSIGSPLVQSEGDSGTTNFVFTVTRSANTAGTASVEYAFAAGDTDAADFVGGLPGNGVVNFADGESSATITIAVSGDEVVESDEDFELVLSNPSSGTIVAGQGTATGTILNDDSLPDPVFSIGSPVVQSEGDSGTTNFVFTVTRSVNTAGTASVEYAFAAGDTDAADFVGGLPGTGVVNFADGESSATITIAVSGDEVVESDEDFGLVLSNPSSGTIADGQGAATGTVLNDDSLPDPVFSIGSPVVQSEGDEGTTSFIFTITRSETTSGAATVEFAFNPGATNAEDFVNGLPAGDTVEFADGQSEATVTIQVQGDLDVEPDESFSLTLTNPSAGTIATDEGTGTGTILNDDSVSIPDPVFSIGSPVVQFEGSEDLNPEIGGVPTTFEFTVTRSDNTSGEASVEFTFDPGDTNGDDYADGLPQGGVVEFLDGESTAFITIDVNPDFEVEADESFTVSLANPSAGTIAAGQGAAVGTILNDDSLPAPVFSIASPQPLVEGDSGTIEFVFVATRTGDTSEAATLDYAFDANGNFASDFGGTFPDATGQFSFGVGDETAEIIIAVSGDELVELDESIFITISNPSIGTILSGQDTATATILNDDSATISAENVEIVEGDEGQTLLVFDLVLDQDVNADVTLDAITVDGTALTSNNDYIFTSVPVTFAESGGAPQVQQVEVPILGDDFVEANESFTLRLENLNAQGRSVSFLGGLSTLEATGTILNDDSAPDPIFGLTAGQSLVEGDSGEVIFTFTATRTANTTGAATLDYSLDFGTTEASDFANGFPASTGQFQFEDGDTSAEITIAVSGDAVVELDESFSLTITNPSVGTISGPDTATATILNDDSAVLSVSNVEANEGDSGTSNLTFSITLDQAVEGEVTFDVATVDGTAENQNGDGDYVQTATSVFFAGDAGEVQTVDVPVVGDETVEPDETFSLFLTNLEDEGRDISFAGGEDFLEVTGTILNDDSLPSNTPPVLVNSGTVVCEGDTVIVDAQSLQVVDEEQAASELIYTVTSLPEEGILSRDGAELGLGDTFTQEDVDNSLVSYTHDGSETTADSVGFSVSDGEVAVNGSLTVTVEPVNDDPSVVQRSAGGTTIFGEGIGLAVLDGSNGFRLKIREGSLVSGSFDNAGDVNGDGFPDVIIGNSFADLIGGDPAGEAYVVFGASGPFPASVSVPATLDGSNGFIVNGINAYDYAGGGVDGVGDINGDGVDDFLITSRYAEPGYVGTNYVVFGTTSGFTSPFELSSLDGSNGFVINGINEEDSTFSSTLHPGDVNGDGIDDLFLSSRSSSPNGVAYSGQGYVVFGTSSGFPSNFDLTSLDGTNGFFVNGAAPSDLASGLHSIGDINGDGVDDLVMSSGRADPDGLTNAGQVYVVFGSNSGFPNEIELSSLDGSNGFTINGLNSFDGLGTPTGIGDINGDGIEDLILSARNASPEGRIYAGQNYVIFGTDAGFDSSFDLASLDGTNGFTINGAYSFDYMGVGSPAGDFDGDGIDDLVLSSSSASRYYGRSYVIFGSASGFGSVLDLQDIDGTNGFTLDGNDGSDFAAAIGGVGDFNGDGLADIGVSALSFAGEAYIVFGAPRARAYDRDAGQPLVLDEAFEITDTELALTDDFGGAVFSVSRLGGANSGDMFSFSDAGNVVGSSSNAAGTLSLTFAVGTTQAEVADVLQTIAFANDSDASGTQVTLEFVFDDGNSVDVQEDNLAEQGKELDASTDGAIRGTFAPIVLLNEASSDNTSPVPVNSGTVVSEGDSVTLDTQSLQYVDGEQAASELVYTITGLPDEGILSRDGAELGLGDTFTQEDVDNMLVSYSHDGTETTADSVGFSVSDGEVSVSGSLTVTVEPVNDDPIATVESVVQPPLAIDLPESLAGLNGTNGFTLIDSQSRGVGLWSRDAGDVNGDGIDDLVVGAQFGDPEGRDGAGQAFVIFGSEGNFDPILDVTDLDGTNGFVIDGLVAGDGLGDAVSSAGDFNGDGVDDLIIGAQNAAPGGQTDAGSTYIIFGRNTGSGETFDLGPGASFDLASLDGTNGFVLNGAESFDYSGTAVSDAGDVNGDGFDDIIVASDFINVGNLNYAGQAVVVFGTDQPVAASRTLSDVADGVAGFAISGQSSFEYVGAAVSDAGDVNGDGIDDIIVSATYGSLTNNSNAGEAYVIFGTQNGFDADFDLGSLDGTNGFALEGVEPNGQTGWSVSGRTDLNGDGIDDVVIGSYIASPGGVSNAGQVHVVFGKDIENDGAFDSVVALNDLDGSDGFALNGVNVADSIGLSVDGTGDLNGDGFDDLIVAGGFGSKQAYLIFGTDQGFASELDVDQIDGTNGIVYDPLPSSSLLGQDFFQNVSRAGDVNGDGVEDVIVGARAVADRDESYVLFGSAERPVVAETLTLQDPELALADDYGGSVLTLERESGALSGDVFFFEDPSGVADPATTNVDGVLSVIFASGTTQAQFDALVQSIRFQSVAEAPGQQVSLGFTFDDGNSVNQLADGAGQGQELDSTTDGQVTGTFLTPAGNTIPFVVANETVTVMESGTVEITPTELEFQDLEQTARDVVYEVVEAPSHGEVVRDGFVLLPGDVFTQADIEAGLVTYRQTGDEVTADAVQVTVTDTLSDPISTSIDIEVQPVNDDPVPSFRFLEPEAVLSLGDLNGNNGFVVNGVGEGARAGQEVAVLGDINGDGIEDLAITAPTPLGQTARLGQTYIVFGRDTANGESFNLDASGTLEAAALDGTDGFRINAVALGDYNTAVSAAGDVNGDGIADVVIGARNADANGLDRAGQSYVVFGQGNGFSLDSNGEFNLTDLDGTDGFAINGEFETDLTGASVSGGGDINGDGIDDLLIGARSAGRVFTPSQGDPFFSGGQAHIIFGQDSTQGETFDLNANGEFDLADLNGTNGFATIAIGPVTQDYTGISVDVIEDVNGDGLNDFIVGASTARNEDGTTVGRAYVVFGQDTDGGESFELDPALNALDLSTLDGTNGFIIEGANQSDNVGRTVSEAGDINGDGINDLLVAAGGAGTNGFLSGAAYVIFGQDTTAGGTFDLTSGTIFDPSDLDGSNGFTLQGINAFDFNGDALGRAGDFNLDGVDDFLIGAWGSDVNGPNSGQAYLIFGQDTEAGESFDLNANAELELSELDGFNGMTFNGPGSPGAAAYSVSGGGDINGDGVDDIVIGARLATPNGSNSGAAYVVFGQPESLPYDQSQGVPLVLDNQARIFDAELDLGNDYGGAVFTLQREGGPDADDVFSFADPGGDVETVNNTGGILSLTFASGTTQEELNAVVQSISYRNDGDDAGTQVTLEFTVDDGNSLGVQQDNLSEQGKELDASTDGAVSGIFAKVTLIGGSSSDSLEAVQDGYSGNSVSGDAIFSGNNLVIPFDDVMVTDPQMGLLGNDDGDQPLEVINFDVTSAQGGVVSVNADGTFTYTAPDGGITTPDTFDYTVMDDAGDTATATVTINPGAPEALADGGDPITFTHVDSNASGSANLGTFEDPFTSLPATQTTDVVYLYSDSVFVDQGYELADGQRLLGEGSGQLHLLPTDQLGTITLPEGSGDGAKPLIQPDSAGSAGTAANDTEISNIVVDSDGIGFLLQDLTGDVNINRSSIQAVSDTLEIFDVDGTVTITGTQLGGGAQDLFISGGSGDVLFGSTQIDPGQGLFGSSQQSTNSNSILLIDHSGSFNLAEGSSLAGGVLLFIGANGTYQFDGTVDVVRSSNFGTTAGLDILDSSGKFTFADLDINIEDSVGDDVPGIRLDGGSADLTIQGGSITQDGDAAVATIEDGHTGTVEISAPVTATNGTGLQFDNADGIYDFAGTTDLNGGNAGIDIVSDSNGTFTFSDTDITNPIGTAFHVNTTSAIVNYTGGIISQNNAQTLVDLSGTSTSSFTFGPVTTLNATNGTGIQIDGVSGSVATFAGPVTLNGGDAGIDITNTNATAIEFSDTSIINPTGTAFNIANVQDSAISITGPITQNNAATAVMVDGFGSSVISFQSPIVANTGAADGVSLTDITGSTLALSGVDIDTTTGTGFVATGLDDSSLVIGLSSIDTTNGQAIDVSATNGTDVTMELSSVSSQNSPTSGISFNNVDPATIVVQTVDIGNAAGTGIEIIDSSGTFFFDNATITDSGGTGIDISGGSSDISINGGTISQSNNQAVVGVTNHAGGTVTIGAAIDASNGDGLQFDNADGIYRFNSTTTIENPTTSGVSIVNGSGTIVLNSLTVLNAAEEGIVIDGFSGTFIQSDGDDLTDLDFLTIDGTGDGFAGIDISNSGLATFTFANPDISNTGAEGALINDGGTVRFSASGAEVGDEIGTTFINSTNGDAINSTNTDLVVTFARIGETGQILGDGIEIVNNDGISRTADLIFNNIFGLGVPDPTGRGVFIDAQSGTLEANLIANFFATDQSTIATQDGGAPGSLILRLDGNSTLTTAQALPTMSFVGSGPNSTIVSSWEFPNQIIGGIAASSGILFDQVTFDADGDPSNGFQQVAFDGGELDIGQVPPFTIQRVEGNGLTFLNPSGDLIIDTLNIANENGTGLLVDANGGAGNFNFVASGGIINTSGGTAAVIDPGAGTIDISGVTLVETVPPVVLDLDGDGLEFLSSQEANVLYDFDGDGLQESTSWVGGDDAFLFLDLDHDGLVSSAQELAFAWQAGAASGSTDLEALHQLHDSNGDAVLSAADTLWEQFGLWQDLDTDGISQPEEVSSLNAAGIVQIDLDSAGSASYQAANGEVSVLGETEFVRTDGSTGIVGDVALEFGQSLPQVEAGEVLSSEPLELDFENLPGAASSEDLVDGAESAPTVVSEAVPSPEADAIAVPPPPAPEVPEAAPVADVV